MLRALLVTILDCNPNRDSAAGLEELARPSYVEVRTSYLQPGLTDSEMQLRISSSSLLTYDYWNPSDRTNCSNPRAF